MWISNSFIDMQKWYNIGIEMSDFKMSSQIRCPCCHSHDVELEKTYEEMVKETQEQLDELAKHVIIWFKKYDDST